MFKRRFTTLYLTGLLVLSAGACSQAPVQQSAVTGASSHIDVPPATETGPGHTRQVGPDSQRLGVKGRQYILELGNGKFVADQTATEKWQPEAGGITLNFQDADIGEFVKTVINDVLNENYVIDEKVVGRVTLSTAKPISKEALLGLLEDILAANGATFVQENGVYRILPKNQVRGSLSPALSRQISAGYGVRIIPLEFIAAQEMQKILEPFLAEGGDLRIDKKRNLVIIAGTQQQIATVQDTIAVFDVDWLRGMSVGLYPLEYIRPEALKTELDSILGALDIDAESEVLGGLVRIVPIERLQSILIIGSTPAALREVELWVHRLDRPGDSAEKRLYVYNVQNAKATELDDILGHIFDSSAISTSPPAKESQPLLGLSPAEIMAGSAHPAPNVLEESILRSRASNGAGVTLPSGQSVDIIADDVRNALVILATPQDYKMVELALAKLDIVPLQVLIEASIIEVSLTDELDYGVEWFFKNNFDRGNVVGGRGTLDLGGAGISALSPSFSYAVLDNTDRARIALNALEEETQVNVLSSPSLMVLDNKTAYISVGDEIPVPARQSISNVNPDSPTVNEIQFRQTGITLTVTPRVNSSGLVTMDIKQEVSNAVSTTSSDIDAPTIQQRQLESTVAVNSGETIVLGGLIQDTESSAESGIPVIHRIPLLGKLFGQSRDEMRRTELLVLITPRVVRNRHDARDVTEEFKRKLQGITPLRKEHLEESAS